MARSVAAPAVPAVTFIAAAASAGAHLSVEIAELDECLWARLVEPCVEISLSNEMIAVALPHTVMCTDLPHTPSLSSGQCLRNGGVFGVQPVSGDISQIYHRRHMVVNANTNRPNKGEVVPNLEAGQDAQYQERKQDSIS